MKHIKVFLLAILLFTISFSAEKQVTIHPSNEYKNASPLPSKESANLKGNVKEVLETHIEKCLSYVKVDVKYKRSMYDDNGFLVTVESKNYDTSQYVIETRYTYKYDYRGYVSSYSNGKKRVLIEYADDSLLHKLKIHKIDDSNDVLTDVIEYVYDHGDEIIQKKGTFLSRNFRMDNHYKKMGNVTELLNFEGENNLSFKNYLTYNRFGDLTINMMILYDTIVGADTTVLDTVNSAYIYPQYDLNNNWLEKRYITLRGTMKKDSILNIVKRQITYY